MRRALVAGNWKMNGRKAQNSALLKAISDNIQQLTTASVDVWVCPPSLYIADVVASLNNTEIKVAAQNVSEYADGAYTGEASAPMLVDSGCVAAIIGHSERRSLFGETDNIVAAKVCASLQSGIMPILCVGETLEQREAGDALNVISAQVKVALSEVDDSADNIAQLVVAYEPVWAIGTGLTASPEQAQEVHAQIRTVLQERFGNVADVIRILYGGSVKAANAAELFSQQDIDGGLIGGASLDADEFLAICNAAANSNG